MTTPDAFEVLEGRIRDELYKKPPRGHGKT
jgi:hypothetical protein